MKKCKLEQYFLNEMAIHQLELELDEIIDNVKELVQLRTELADELMDDYNE